jgi:predicted SAM-dependent methyltransferase
MYRTTKLHLCCGFDYKTDFINVDNIPNGIQDITADLNKDWDFAKTNSIDYIFIKDGLEHLNSLEHFFKETERVLKPGGKIEIWVPHYKSPSAYRLTHKHYFSWSFFNAFPEPHDPTQNLKVISNKIIVEANKFPFTLLNHVANINPKLYEKFFYVASIRTILQKTVYLDA